jgi:hypothetical protein
MEDVVRKMQEIPYFQSLHHEGEGVVQSLQSFCKNMDIGLEKTFTSGYQVVDHCWFI